MHLSHKYIEIYFNMIKGSYDSLGASIGLYSEKLKAIFEDTCFIASVHFHCEFYILCNLKTLFDTREFWFIVG